MADRETWQIRKHKQPLEIDNVALEGEGLEKFEARQPGQILYLNDVADQDRQPPQQLQPAQPSLNPNFMEWMHWQQQQVTGPTKVAVTAATTTGVPEMLGANQTRGENPPGGSLEQSRESFLGRTGQTGETPSGSTIAIGHSQTRGAGKAPSPTKRLGGGSMGTRQEASPDR